jgi:hypothetical protein
LDFVHALADTHLGREVKDGVAAAQYPPHEVRVPHITSDEFGVQEDRAQMIVTVHLLVQPINHAHLVPLPKQRQTHVPANETGAAGDQYASWHNDPFRPHI